MVGIKNLAKELEEIALLYEKHIIEQKINSFRKKYNKDFQEFEKEVLSKEHFEQWDDYMEWKAYIKQLEELESYTK